jgi:hypothetical protein
METHKMVTVALWHARLRQDGHAHHRRAVNRTAPHRAGIRYAWETRSVTTATTGPMTAAAALAISSAGTSAITRPETSSRLSAKPNAATG